MGVSEKKGYLICGPYNKDPTIWGTIEGSPIFGNSQIGVRQLGKPLLTAEDSESEIESLRRIHRGAIGACEAAERIQKMEAKRRQSTAGFSHCLWGVQPQKLIQLVCSSDVLCPVPWLR